MKRVVLLLATHKDGNDVAWIRESLGSMVTVISSTGEFEMYSGSIRDHTVIILDSEMQWLLFGGPCPKRLVAVNITCTLEMLAGCNPQYLHLSLEERLPKRVERAKSGFRRFIAASEGE